MNVYADKEFYLNEFLLGRTAIIPDDDILYWLRKASSRINRKNIEIDEIPDYLKNCTCEVAEALFLDSEKKFIGMMPSSQSVGEYSKNSPSDSRQERKELESEINRIINDWLVETKLHNLFVFRGAR